MNCKGCNESNKLVKSHIIPKSFFKYLREDEDTLIMRTSSNPSRRLKSPIGEYDSEILCATCEKKFQLMDDYAAKILIQEPTLEQINRSGEVLLYMQRGIDYLLLKNFVIGLLWRASISNRDFYSKVDLGPFEDIAKEAIWSKQLSDKHLFSFFLCRFPGSSSKLERGIFSPVSTSLSGINYYKFSLGSYALYVKADSRVTPRPFDELISESEDLLILANESFENSREFTVMKSIAVN